MTSLYQSRYGGYRVGHGLRAFVIATAVFVLAVFCDRQVLAQAAPPAAGTYMVIQDGSKQVPSLSLTVKEIIGQDILYGTRRLATVAQVLADPSGKPVAVVARFGGYFGFFEDQVVLPLDKVNPGRGYLDGTISPETLEKLPPWK